MKNLLVVISSNVVLELYSPSSVRFIIMTIIAIIIIKTAESIIGDTREQVTHEIINSLFDKRGNMERMREKVQRERKLFVVAKK